MNLRGSWTGCTGLGLIGTDTSLAPEAFEEVPRHDRTAAPALSVVVPCYNEEAGLAELYRRLTAACEGLGVSYEVVLVNDGSSDRTWPRMLGLAAADRRFVLVNLSRNFGHQLALTAGLRTCRGDRILVIDADLQDPPELLPRMMKAMDDGADVVYGRRRSRRGEGPLKLATAWLFYRLLGLLTDVPVPCDVGDFRLMSRRVLDALLAMPERRRFIRGMVSWVGFHQVPLSYDREARFAGATAYSFRKMAAFAADAVISSSTRPLALAGYGGGMARGVAGLLIAWALALALSGRAVPGWVGWSAVSCILSGVQLVSLGVSGAYLGRVFEQCNGRPLYVVERMVRASREGGDPVPSQSYPDPTSCLVRQRPNPPLPGNDHTLRETLP